MRSVLVVLTAVVAVLLAVPASAAIDGASAPSAEASAPSAEALIPRLWRNCTNYNKRYPHGVGRLLARDKVSAGSEPVRNFKRSNRIFAIAMSYNRGLDRDKDRIACEKH